ncbi:MAG TPA: hypothetical protein PKG63_08975 [Bacteroidales bacterium]|nr:hypothetical protein [Bacteroidales bacterium]
MPFSPMRVRRRALSPCISLPHACPAPLDASTVIRDTISLAFAFSKPNFVKIVGR